MTIRSLSILALFSLVACARQEAVDSAPSDNPSPSRDTAVKTEVAPQAGVGLPARPSLPDDSAASIYDLAVRLTDDGGADRALDAFRGRPLLVTMFYAGCASACPLLSADLRRIEQKLPESVRSSVRVLMVSFDAARDTPAVLARLKQERGMDPARWTLASARDDDARELAGLLGIRYRKLDNGEFFHSSVIVLIDARGRVVVKLDGLGSDPAPVVAALSALET